MPLVDPPLKTLRILVILVGYVWLTLANLDSLFCLVKRFGVSPFYLTGRGFAPIIVGVAIGYAVGFVCLHAFCGQRYSHLGVARLGDPSFRVRYGNPLRQGSACRRAR